MSGQPSASRNPLYLSAWSGHTSSRSGIPSKSASGVGPVSYPSTSGQPSKSSMPLKFSGSVTQLSHLSSNPSPSVSGNWYSL